MLTSVFLPCDLPREEVAPTSLSWQCRSLMSDLLAMLFHLRDWFTPTAPLCNNSTTTFSMGRDTLCLERMISGMDREAVSIRDLHRQTQTQQNILKSPKTIENGRTWDNLLIRKSMQREILSLVKNQERLLWELWNPACHSANHP